MRVCCFYYPDVRDFHKDVKRFAFGTPPNLRRVKTVRELAALLGYPRRRANRLANAIVKTGIVRRVKGQLLWPEGDISFTISLLPQHWLQDDLRLKDETNERLLKLEKTSERHEKMIREAQDAVADAVQSQQLSSPSQS
jgi:hypothetical protein